MPSRLDHSPSCMWPPADRRVVLAVLGQQARRPSSDSRWRTPWPGASAAVVLDAVAVVGEEAHAEAASSAIGGEPLPARPTVMAAAAAARRQSASRPSCSTSFDDAGAVDAPARVLGIATTAGEAAEGGGPAAGLDGLGLLLAGLAQVGVEVDEARGDDAAAGVER